MNIYQWIIVSALLGKYLLDLFSEWMNIQSLLPQLPAEFRDTYDPEKYSKSQDYTKARTRFEIVESTFGLAVLFVFWFSGGFNKLDELVRSWNFHPILTGILYIGILTIASNILSLPFSVYSTFVIEERFGFNRTTPSTFIMDRLKGLFLMVLLGAPFLALILWFFQRTGYAAWLYCWLAATVFMLAVQFIAPTWIMPLFNKFTPLQEGELKEAIRDYARSVRFLFKDIFIMDGSKRSSKANAFFTGFGRNKRIALFDTLVSDTTIPEVVAVLAHEIGHYKKRHVLLMMVIGIVHMGIIFFLLSFFLKSPALFSAFYMKHMSTYAGLLFFGLLYEPISFLLSLLMNMFSRRNELQADRFAVETVQDREKMVSALKKLSVRNLSNLTPHPFYVFLNYSHPPLLERIEKIRKNDLAKAPSSQI